MIGDAIGSGLLQGLTAGATNFAQDAILETAISALPIPYADGLINVITIAQDPAAFAEQFTSLGKGAETAFVSNFVAIGDEDNAFGYIAAALEAIIGIIDFINQIVGLLNQIFTITMFVCYILWGINFVIAKILASNPFTAAIAPVFETIAAFFMWWVRFIDPINNILSNVGNILTSIKLILTPIAFIFRLADILESDASPEEMMAKQAKLQGHVAGFTQTMTERGLNATKDAGIESFTTEGKSFKESFKEKAGSSLNPVGNIKSQAKAVKGASSQLKYNYDQAKVRKSEADIRQDRADTAQEKVRAGDAFDQATTSKTDAENTATQSRQASDVAQDEQTRLAKEATDRQTKASSAREDHQETVRKANDAQSKADDAARLKTQKEQEANNSQDEADVAANLKDQKNQEAESSQRKAQEAEDLKVQKEQEAEVADKLKEQSQKEAERKRNEAKKADEEGNAELAKQLRDDADTADAAARKYEDQAQQAHQDAELAEQKRVQNQEDADQRRREAEGAEQERARKQEEADKRTEEAESANEDSIRKGEEADKLRNEAQRKEEEAERLRQEADEAENNRSTQEEEAKRLRHEADDAEDDAQRLRVEADQREQELKAANDAADKAAALDKGYELTNFFTKEGALDRLKGNAGVFGQHHGFGVTGNAVGFLYSFEPLSDYSPNELGEKAAVLTTDDRQAWLEDYGAADDFKVLTINIAGLPDGATVDSDEEIGDLDRVSDESEVGEIGNESHGLFNSSSNWDNDTFSSTIDVANNSANDNNTQLQVIIPAGQYTFTPDSSQLGYAVIDSPSGEASPPTEVTTIEVYEDGGNPSITLTYGEGASSSDTSYATTGDVPTPTAAEVAADGDTVTVTFNEDLSNTSTPAEAFAITVAGAPYDDTRAAYPDRVQVSGNTVTLDSPSTSFATYNETAPLIGEGQTADVMYGRDHSNGQPLHDGDENLVADFNQPATNNSTQDLTQPQLESNEVKASGNQIQLTYDDSLDSGSVPATDDYVVTVDGNAIALDSVTISDTQVILVPSTTIYSGGTVTIAYIASGDNPLQDTAGNRASSLSESEITNNSTQVLAESDENTDGTETPVAMQLQRAPDGGAVMAPPVATGPAIAAEPVNDTSAEPAQAIPIPDDWGFDPEAANESEAAAPEQDNLNRDVADFDAEAMPLGDFIGGFVAMFAAAAENAEAAGVLNEDGSPNFGAFVEEFYGDEMMAAEDSEEHNTDTDVEAAEAEAEAEDYDDEVPETEDREAVAVEVSEIEDTDSASDAMSQIIEQLPDPPEDAATMLSGTALAYGEVDAIAYEVSEREQVIDQQKEHSEAQVQDMQASRGVVAANQDAVGLHQQEIDQTQAAQEEQKKLSSDAESQSQEGDSQSSAVEGLFSAVLSPVMAIFSFAGSQGGDADNAGDPSDAGQQTTEQSQAIGDTANANQGTTKMSDARIKQSEGARKDADAAQDELSDVDATLAEKEADATESAELIDEADGENDEMMSETEDEKADLEGNHAEAYDELADWGADHQELRLELYEQYFGVTEDKEATV
ncbi:MAG: hypothetical protein HC910_21810 [Spirulinaceae cyanobacterium SM2_1_0]|nr:hypothetical protein [Spirulinaceae cyanobacterium SM2_1_0]